MSKGFCLLYLNAHCFQDCMLKQWRKVLPLNLYLVVDTCMTCHSHHYSQVPSSSDLGGRVAQVLAELELL